MRKKHADRNSKQRENTHTEEQNTLFTVSVYMFIFQCIVSLCFFSFVCFLCVHGSFSLYTISVCILFSHCLWFLYIFFNEKKEYTQKQHTMKKNHVTRKAYKGKEAKATHRKCIH